MTNYLKVVEFFPSDYPAYHYLAPLLLQIGDMEGYQRHRQRIVQQFGSTSDPIIAERLSKDCLVLPPGATNLELITKMADVAVAAGPAHTFWRYFQFVKGLAEYRSGHFAAAADWLQKVLDEKGHWNRRVATLAVLAMAQHQLGQVEQARVTLEDGVQTASRVLPKSPDNLGDDWNDWIIAHLLLREAQILIGGGAPK